MTRESCRSKNNRGVGGGGRGNFVRPYFLFKCIYLDGHTRLFIRPALGKRASKHEHSIYLLFLIDRRLKRRHSLLFRVYSRNPFFSKNSSLYFLQKNLLLRGIVFWKILQFPKVKSISRSRVVKDPSLEQIFSTDPVYIRPQ